MSKTAAERQRDSRAKRKAITGEPGSILDAFVDHLRDEVEHLRAVNETLRHELSRVTSQLSRVTENVTENLSRIGAEITSTLAGNGGFGGSRSGSPSPLHLLKKEREAQEFQDLNGETRGRGVLSNGTRVPGRLGDEVVTGHDVTNGHVVTDRDVTAASNLDSPKTETRARGTLLGPPLLGELSEDELERRRRTQLEALAKLEAGE